MSNSPGTGVIYTVYAAIPFVKKGSSIIIHSSTTASYSFCGQSIYSYQDIDILNMIYIYYLWYVVDI